MIDDGLAMPNLLNQPIFAQQLQVDEKQLTVPSLRLC